MGLLTSEQMPVGGNKKIDNPDQKQESKQEAKKNVKLIDVYSLSKAPEGAANAGILLDNGQSVTIQMKDGVYVEDKKMPTDLRHMIIEALVKNGFILTKVPANSKEVNESKESGGSDSGTDSKKEDLVDVTEWILCHPDHSEEEPLNIEYKVEMPDTESKKKNATKTIIIDVVEGHVKTKDPVLAEALQKSGFILMAESDGSSTIPEGGGQ